MSNLALALIVETWWGACLLFHHARLTFVLAAFGATFVWPNFAYVLGYLSLAILSHVGYRGMARLIIETARRRR